MTDIVLRDPFEVDGALAPVHRAMHRLLDDMSPAWTRGTWIEEPLPVDVSEADGDLKVEASLPGFDKDEIDVELSEGVLTIKAHHREEHEERKPNYYRRERRIGALSRRIELPGRIPDDARIDAHLKDGILSLTVPVPEAARARRIEVKAS